MHMDMSWKPLTQLLQATSPGPVSPPSPWSHHLLGLLQIACSGTCFPFQLNSLPLCPGPINAQWLSLNRRSNQGLMRLISRNLGRFVFSNMPSFLGFSFASRSLATLWLARSTTLKLISTLWPVSNTKFCHYSGNGNKDHIISIPKSCHCSGNGNRDYDTSIPKSCHYSKNRDHNVSIPKSYHYSRNGNGDYITSIPKFCYYSKSGDSDHNASISKSCC